MSGVIRFASILALLVAVVGVGGFISPAPAAAATGVTCNGNDLQVAVEINLSAGTTNHYRINGTGPGLPSSSQTVLGPGTAALTFTISGPGSWSDLSLEFLNVNVSDWTASRFSSQVVPTSITCDGPVVSDVAGPDMVSLPSQAVVGAFVANTVALFAPDAAATTPTMIEVGKTLWVLGVDSSGSFYKVLISGRAFWVPVSSMGPNSDDVWNGTPLPTTVVN